MRKSHIAVPVVLSAVLTLFGCGDVGGGPFTTDSEQAQDPAGNTPLLGVDQYEIHWALEKTREQVAEGRGYGVQLALDTFRGYLQQAGLDATVLDGVGEASIGGPMPGGTVANAPLQPEAADSDVSSTQHALRLDDQDKYYGCPLDAPEENSGTACDDMVDEVARQVVAKIEEHKDEVARLVAEQFGCLEATAMEFVEAWAQYAEEYGAEVALIYAKHELKAAGMCDVQVNSGLVSYELGVEQGWQIVLELKAWAEEQVETCVVNITEIVEQVRLMAKSKITAFMEEHAVCVDHDVNRFNGALQTAEVRRRVGIEAGIEERVEILRTELHRTEQLANEPGGPCWTPPPPPPNPNGPPPHQGSPLVIDLEGDFDLQGEGQTLRSAPVSFDLLANGTPQRATWVGPRGALLAHDADGDGMITSGAELMGNAADCDGRRCFDGAAALARFDAPARGGNGDGVIDRRDRAYGRLLLWQDRDGDAVSQPGELSTLAARGVRAIALQPSYPGLSSVAGRISVELSLTTDRGEVRPVYDVWFGLEHAPQLLSRLRPLR